MPGGFQLGYGAANFQSIGADETASVGTSLTPNASANTKGSYSQLVASLPYDATMLDIYLTGLASSATTRNWSVDIAVGGSGSEQIIIPDLVAGGQNYHNGYHYRFPLSVPAGTRIAARCQSDAGATQNIGAMVVASGGSFDFPAPLGFVSAYGFNAAASIGTVVDPGSSANTKGAWTEITSSLTYDVRYLEFGIGPDVLGPANLSWLFDIAIGASGSEQVILSDLFSCRANTDIVQLKPPGVAVNIPAGTRIAARAQSNVTGATSRKADVTLYGVN